jgi:ferredoxin
VPKVRFTNELIETEVPSGTTLLRAAEQAGVAVHRGFWSRFHCRGLGLCGSCKMWVSSPQALAPPGTLERIRYTVRGALRLGCRARVIGDVEVRTKPGGPAPSQSLDAYQLLRPPGAQDPPAAAPKAAPPAAAGGVEPPTP